MEQRLTRTKIKKYLDEVFSHYIRLKYADATGTTRCWTCDKSAPYNKLYCGHFASRKYLPTRWDERNCRPQCYACNILRSGEQWVFGKRLNARTSGTAERVYADAQSGRKWTTDELCNMVSHYRKALTEEIARIQRESECITKRTIAVISRIDKLEIFRADKDVK